MKKKLYIRISIYIALFLCSIGIEHYTDIDIYIQSFFYNESTGTWLITKKEHKGILGLILYKGYKQFLLGSGILALFACLYYSFYRKNTVIALFLLQYILALILIPLIVGILKPVTNVYCPAQVDIFGGFAPYIRIMESYPAWFSSPNGRCFPAGHATSGFFLCILYYALQKTPYARYKWYGLMVGLVCGWVTGIYQMMRGEHFISHTVITMLIALAVSDSIHTSIDMMTKKSK